MKSKALLILVLVFSVASFVYSYTAKNELRLAYIDTRQVFDNFDYTKILKREFELNTLIWKSKIDSLVFEDKIIVSKIANSSDIELNSILKSISLEINNKIDDYQRAYENLSNKYDNQIFIQLNSYLEEFGVSENLDMVFGTENLGNLVFSKEQHNVTEKAIKFVNNRFNSTKDGK